MVEANSSPEINPTEKHMLIVYSSDTDVLICESEVEDSMLSIWFAAKTGRKHTDYDRDECHSGIVRVRPHLRTDID